MKTAPVTTFIAIGICQAILLSCALLLQPKRGRANVSLGVLLLVLALALGWHWLYISGAWRGVPKWMLIGTTVTLLIGPLLWAYVRQATTARSIFTWGWTLHLLPWAVDAVRLAPAMGVPDDTLVRAVAQSMAQYRAGSISLDVMTVIRGLSLAGYTLICLRHLRRWRTALRDQVADDQYASFRWLSGVLAVFACVSLLVIGSMLLGPRSPVPADYVISLAMVTFVLAIGIAGLRQPALFNGEASSAPADTDPTVILRYDEPFVAASVKLDGGQDSKVRTRPLAMPAEQAARLSERLDTVMEQDHLYREHDLSLPRLARAVGATPHQVSEVLNVHLQCTFYEFVNRYRIDEVKRGLASTDQSVLDLALSSGFSNKSTFNKVFKECTGMTPSIFRRGASV